MKGFDKNIITSILLANKSQIQKLGVIELGLFGSYVRNEENRESDIDILVEFESSKETFDNFINLCFLFDELFKDKKVEVVTKDSLSPYIGPYILKEVEYVRLAG